LKRLEINNIQTLLDHMDWEGEIREVKCSSTFVKGKKLSSSTHGLRSLREDCTPGKHQEIKVDTSWTSYL
jgi:hypothetical protein